MKEQILNSLEYTGIFIAILLITIITAYLTNRYFNRLIKRSTEEMHTDPTNYQFLRHGIRAIIYIVGFSIAIYAMPNLRALASSLLAGAGILAVAVGFASQHALSNVISGVFIIIFKPFRVNDRVSIRDLTGVVEDITLRHTVIRDFQNKRIIIPNTLISDEVLINSNYQEDQICKWIEFGISYDSNVQKAKNIMHEEIIKHPFHIDPRTEQQIEDGEELAPVRIVRFEDSSVILRGWAWSKDPIDGFKMECELFESIKLRFDNEGIEIPFPYRTLVYKDQKVNPKEI